MTDPTPEELLRIAREKVAKWRAAEDESAYLFAVDAANAYADAVAKRGTEKWFKARGKAWR